LFDLKKSLTFFLLIIRLPTGQMPRCDPGVRLHCGSLRM